MILALHMLMLFCIDLVPKKLNQKITKILLFKSNIELQMDWYEAMLSQSPKSSMPTLRVRMAVNLSLWSESGIPGEMKWNGMDLGQMAQKNGQI